jgi:hypothetical protein
MWVAGAMRRGPPLDHLPARFDAALRMHEGQRTGETHVRLAAETAAVPLAFAQTAAAPQVEGIVVQAKCCPMGGIHLGQALLERAPLVVIAAVRGWFFV